MANTYVFSRSDNKRAQRSDGAFIPWNPQTNQPADIEGNVARQWKEDGSPIPDPYVAPPLNADQIRTAQLDGDVDRQDIVNALKTATPAQIKNYITNNVTDLATARTMLIKLALLVTKTLRD